MEPTQRYIEPGWFTRRIFNPLVRRFARWGVSYRGTRELAVVGRTSGQVPDDGRQPARARRPAVPRRAAW